MAVSCCRTCLVALTVFSILTMPGRRSGIVHAAGGVQPMFDLDAISGSPFPSDLFTVPDDTQNTGILVNLPKPDCGSYPYDFVEIDLVNELDGFHVQPRASIPFSGPIDPTSVTSQNVFFLKLDSGHQDESPIMTTWHSGQPLREALLFFLETALPDEYYAGTTHASLAISIGSPEWAREIAEALDDPRIFIAE